MGSVLLVSGCASVHVGVDVRALEGTARLVEQRATVSARPWPFSSQPELEARTRPLPTPAFVERLPIGARSLHVDGLIEEQLVFRSRISLRAVESNHARLLVFRHGPLGQRPVLLWVPGLGLSELAMRLLGPLLRDAVGLGFDVVFFVPPYHLERSPRGGRLATRCSRRTSQITSGWWRRASPT
ncbi:MAG: hypothetical protein SFW67_06925 [Myxococcaceae bacterium]|nr:hypothetical protein [Myxococcaceae bacterium]